MILAYWHNQAAPWTLALLMFLGSLAWAAADAPPGAALAAAEVAATQALIEKHYQHILRRQPDSGGLETYTRALLQDGENEQWLIQVLRASPEARQLRKAQRAKLVKLLLGLGTLVLAIGFRRPLRLAWSVGRKAVDRVVDRWQGWAWPSWGAFCGALGLLFFLRGLILLSVYPPLEGFDEHQHIAYLVFVNEQGQQPRYGTAQIPFSLYADLVANPHSDYGWQQLKEIGARRYKHFWSAGTPPAPDYRSAVMLSAAFHPPLYYKLFASLFVNLKQIWGFRPAVYALRLINLALAAFSVMLYVWPLRRLFATSHHARAVALVVSLAPMYLVYAARISSDGLALLISAAAFAGLAAFPRQRPAGVAVSALLLGALLGLGMLVRASAAVWLLVTLVYMSWLFLNGRLSGPLALMALALSLTAFMAVALPQFLNNLALYGQAIPGQEGVRLIAAQQGFAAIITAARFSDLNEFFIIRMIRDNLWTSGWLFLQPALILRRIYFGCVLACWAGAAFGLLRLGRPGQRLLLGAGPLIALGLAATLLTFAGAYLHALSCRAAYGSILTPAYYAMPAFLPFLALTLQAAGGWGRLLEKALLITLGSVFIITEFYGTFFIGAPRWAYTLAPMEIMRRLAELHPTFPSPAWLAPLCLGYGLLGGLLAISIRASARNTRRAHPPAPARPAIDLN